jgi:hypothetical protein
MPKKKWWKESTILNHLRKPNTCAYEIKPIPAGTYTLSISATGFKEKTIKEVTVKQAKQQPQCRTRTCIN